MTDYRTAFEKALKENPHDVSTRQMYADWLQEQGLDDEAAEQLRRTSKEWLAALDWMIDFASKCGRHCENYTESWEEYRRETEHLSWGNEADRPTLMEVQDRYHAKRRWRNINLEDCLQAGYDFLREGDYFVQCGSEQARDLMYEEGMAKLFWINWFMLTGEPSQDHPDLIQGEESSAPFSCSC